MAVARLSGVTFELNKQYVREVLASQVDLRADGLEYVDDADLPADHRSRLYREVVNAGGNPSEMVIEETRRGAGSSETRPKVRIRSRR